MGVLKKVPLQNSGTEGSEILRRGSIRHRGPKRLDLPV
jgi:hypothetical protein